MRCTFVAIGAENISLEVLSAMLKRHGHVTSLAFDQALFDDKNYLHKPLLAKVFDHKDTVLKQIIDSRPDLVAFSVMTPTYSWATLMSQKIKEHLNVPVVFGGAHPTTLPDQTIKNEFVDIICIGEGDYPLLELCNSIERKCIDYSIQNLWFKTKDGIIRNPQRKIIENLDSLPLPDKELFEKHISIKNFYLAVTSRGCPYACSYCSLNFFAKEAEKLKGPRLRERSVDSVLMELKTMHAKYGFKWIDFRNNTFTARREWVLNFLERYKAEISIPFRVFGHPATIDRTIAQKLKEANCFSVQLGIESLDSQVRKKILHRHETDKQILSAVEAMDAVGLPYSMDYILGIPTQSERELVDAAHFFMDRTSCFRVSPFMLQYLPKLDIIKYGIQFGELTDDDIKILEKGLHDHYVSTGSMGKDPRKLRFLMAYRLLFRMIPLVPKSITRLVLQYKIYKIFPYLPLDIILSIIDFIMVVRRFDKDAVAYAKHYWHCFINRFNRHHPAYWIR